MSLTKQILRLKNKFNNIKKIVSNPEYYFYSNKDYLGLKDFYLELNTTFKHIEIECTGTFDIIKPPYDGYSIVSSKNKIIITNFRKIVLEENIIFSFYGGVTIGTALVPEQTMSTLFTNSEI